MADLVEDPVFPDRVSANGGPLIPCKVTEFSVTDAPVTTEGPREHDGTKLIEQTRQYVIRYDLPPGTPRFGPVPERVAMHYWSNVTDEQIARDRQDVLESARQVLAEQSAPERERIEAAWTTSSGEPRTAAIDLYADPRPDDPRSLFGRLPHVVVGQGPTPVHALVLDAYRRAQGLPPWLRRPPGSTLILTAREVNEAVDWWNEWQDGGADG